MFLIHYMHHINLGKECGKKNANMRIANVHLDHANMETEHKQTIIEE